MRTTVIPAVTGLVVVLALFGAGCGNEGLGPVGARGGAPDAVQAVTGRIAFSSMRDGNYEIYVMNADGTGQKRLTREPANDRAPSWSPDGGQIVFHSGRTGSGDLYVMKANGSTQRLLVGGPDNDGSPAWSPNGKSIVFVRFLATGGTRLFTANATTGKNVKPLTPITNHEIDQTPAWSPDSTQVVYSHTGPAGTHLWVIKADGTGNRQLTTGARRDLDPAWSPDGNRMAFTGIMPNNSVHVFVIKSDGTGVRQLTHTTKGDFTPGWSPDGRRIAFVSQRTGGGDIYSMPAAGGAAKRLTTSPSEDTQPDWWAVR